MSLRFALPFVLAILSSASPVWAELIVKPSTPLSNHGVSILYHDPYAGAVSIQTVAMERNGSQIDLSLRLHWLCMLPGGSGLRHVFALGTLPPGPYTVNLEIAYIGDPPEECKDSVRVVTTSFSVAEAPEVPTVSGFGLVVLASLLLLFGVSMLRARSNDSVRRKRSDALRC